LTRGFRRAVPAMTCFDRAGSRLFRLGYSLATMPA
jgi:hypothetical protein